MGILKTGLGLLGDTMQSDIGQGLMGLIGGGSMMKQGYDKQKEILGGLGDEDKIRSLWGNSQDLITRMTNFGNYSGQTQDLSTQGGNKAVETANQLGVSGSQSNAIRNRLRNQDVGQTYQAWNDALPGAMKAQGELDTAVAGQYFGEMGQKRHGQMGMANQQMAMGSQFMPKDIFGKTGMLSKIGGLLGGGG